MSNTQNRELKIDAQFRDLIPPLTEEERKQLEDVSIGFVGILTVRLS